MTNIPSKQPRYRNGKWAPYVRPDAEIRLTPVPEVGLGTGWRDKHEPLADAGGLTASAIAPMKLTDETACLWAASSDARLRFAVGINRSTSSDILDHLADDPVTEIRHSVALNPNATWGTVNVLTHDFAGDVRSAALRRFTCTQEHIDLDHRIILINVFGAQL